MKQVRAIVLLLDVAGCVFLAYRLSHSPESSGNPSSPQADTQCDQSLWQYVYHPARLRVLAPCISVTGVADEVRKEADGDIHILFRVDRKFESLLNDENIAREHGEGNSKPAYAEPALRHPAIGRRRGEGLRTGQPSTWAIANAYKPG